jgi:3'-phosphoadenosine 5'-phosphosulfate sulfotransferase (PAPS reductase)/FAD synthetase
MILAHEIFGTIPRPPRFVIFSSYGNDSVALIQWAHDQGLKDVVVVFSDTGWAAKWWADRVVQLEYWVHTLGFWTDRTTSIGFVGLAFEKQAFPTQMYQWCSYRLKIEPGERWLAENDPDGRAVCLVGVRREESQDRADFPRYVLSSNSHGGRVMVAPMAEWSAADRDHFLERAGVTPLPHRSMECSPCINANKEDLRATAEDDIQKAEDVEASLHDRFGLTKKGKRRTIFRPARCGGAVGVREVVRWAHSPRGKYVPPEPYAPDANELTIIEAEDSSSSGCEAGWCGT